MSYYDYYNWKPSIKPKVYKNLLKRLSEVFENQVKEARFNFNDEELRDLSWKHRKDRLEKDPSKGRFVLFLDAWNIITEETEDQKEKRIIANYIRHQLTSYDKELDLALSKYWMPGEFFTEIWVLVMSKIVESFPDLEVSLERGKIAKDAYKNFKSLSLFSEDKDKREEFLNLHSKISEEHKKFMKEFEVQRDIKLNKEFEENPLTIFAKENGFEAKTGQYSNNNRYIFFNREDLGRFIFIKNVYDDIWRVYTILDDSDPECLERALKILGKKSKQYKKLRAIHRSFIKSSEYNSKGFKLRIGVSIQEHLVKSQGVFSGKNVESKVNFSGMSSQKIENRLKNISSEAKTVFKDSEDRIEKFVKNDEFYNAIINSKQS